MSPRRATWLSEDCSLKNCESWYPTSHAMRGKEERTVVDKKGEHY